MVMVLFDPGRISQVPDAHAALVAGAFGSPAAMAETLASAAPLICAGLGIALAFKAGLSSAPVARRSSAHRSRHWSGSLTLPPGLHRWWPWRWARLPEPAGVHWPAKPRARFGAHEVITTIMLNHVAAGLLAYALTTPGFQRVPGEAIPSLRWWPIQPSFRRSGGCTSELRSLCWPA